MKLNEKTLIKELVYHENTRAGLRWEENENVEESCPS